MKVNAKWRGLGWRHPLWDYVRFYSVVRRQKKVRKEAWVEKLKTENKFEIDDTNHILLPAGDVKLFFDYLDERVQDFEHAKKMLRTEAETLAHCTTLAVAVSKVKTQNVGHHQSSSAVVAAVSAIASAACQATGLTLNIKPDRRAVWFVSGKLHVTARNLDGAIPSLLSPPVVWEIKEYWGGTKGGSKMSDALYECLLVGRELREFEETSKTKVIHVVFLDGKQQWGHRESDLRRFIDLFHQGIIAELIIGKEVETDWGPLLATLLPKPPVKPAARPPNPRKPS